MGRCGGAWGRGSGGGFERREFAGLPGAEEVFEAGEEIADLAVDEEDQQGAFHHLGRAMGEGGGMEAIAPGRCFYHKSYYI